jgi:hypothetical protein
MGCDPTTYPAGVNVGTEGTAFSTITGVLAGFAFTAIVLLLIAALDPKSPASRLLHASGRALVGSFVGLLIMSALYAREASSAYSCGLSISENTILAGGFVGVSILYYYAFVLMLEAAGSSWQADSALAKGLAGLARFGRITAIALPFLVLGLVYDATSDYTAIKYGAGSGLTAIGWLGIALLALQVAVSAWALAITVRSERPGRFAQGELSSSTILPVVGLGLPLAAAIAFVAIDTTESETAVIPPASVAVILVVACICAVAATIYLALTRPGLPAWHNQEAPVLPPPRYAGAEQQPSQRITAPLASGFSVSVPRLIPAVFAFASIVVVARLIRQLIWPPK